MSSILKFITVEKVLVMLQVIQNALSQHCELSGHVVSRARPFPSLQQSYYKHVDMKQDVAIRISTDMIHSDAYNM